MARFVRYLLVASFAVTLAVALLAVYAYRQTQQAPEFYVQALSRPAAEPAKAAYKFEQEALELQNSVRREGEWQATFTQEEINGWLAHDLPEKFPDALPGTVSDPRVAIDPKMIQVACKYAGPQFSSVVSLGVEPKMTAEPNVIAVRVRQVRAGALPVPLGNFLEMIAEHCAMAGLPLRWTEQEGDPVAVITIPMEKANLKDKLLRVESIELRDGAVVISGKTEAERE